MNVDPSKVYNHKRKMMYSINYSDIQINPKITLLS